MRWPLLSGRALIDFAPQEYHDYVRSLYREPEKKTKGPAAEYSVRLNAKGTPVITIKRKPQFLTSAEVTSIAQELSKTTQEIWMQLKKRKIMIKIPESAK